MLSPNFTPFSHSVVFGSARFPPLLLVLETSTIALRDEALASPGRQLLEQLLRNEPGSLTLATQPLQVLSSVGHIQTDVIHFVQNTNNALHEPQKKIDTFIDTEKHLRKWRDRLCLFE